MNFGNVKKIVLLGGLNILVNCAKYLNKKKIEYVIFSSQRQMDEEIEDGKTFSEVISKIGSKVFISKNINDDKNLKDYVDKNTIAMSFSAAWIIKQNTIDLFNGKIVNLHETRLPQNRGGGGFSWQIMRGNNLGYCTLHLIDKGIDSGDIVCMEEFLYPDSCKTSKDFFEYMVKKDKVFIEKFVNSVLDNKDFSLSKQNESFSTYWPRLNTNINGYINWSWNLFNIYRFICAFDDPYIGASTYIGDKRVFLKDVTMDENEGGFHPFQSGIVFRKNNEALFVCTETGTLIIKKVLNEKGIDIKETIIVGMRFNTPTKLLDNALSSKIIYTHKGLKKNDL